MTLKNVWRVLTSVWLAAVLTALIALATAVGTVLPNEISLAYVYGSVWFTALLALFCVNLFCCAFKSLPARATFFGVFLIHTGIIVVIVGGAGTRYLGQRGTLGLTEGVRAGSFQGSDGGEVPLGFEVVLDRFRAEFYPPRLHVRFTGSQGEGEDFLPEEGASRRILGGRYEVALVRYFPTYEEREEVFPDAPPEEPGVAPANPTGVALELEVASAGPQARTETMWIFPEQTGRDRLESQDGSFAVLAILCATDEEFQARTAPAESAQPQWLFVRLPDAGITRRIPVEVGQEFDVGEGYRIRIEEVRPDYANPGPDNPPRNPAIRTTLIGPQGEETRWAFALHPQYDQMHQARYANVRLTYEASTGGTGIRMEFVRSPAGDWTYVEKRGGDDPAVRPLPIGEPLAIEGAPVRIAVRRVLPQAWVRRTETCPDPRPRRPVLSLRVRGPEGEETLLLPAGHDWHELAGGRLEVRTDEKVDTVKEFLSELAIYQGDREVARQTVEVNVPLRYGGYAFYQSDYNPDQLNWSGLQVVKDPGNLVVYIGFGLLSFGLVYAATIRPLLSKERA